MNKCALCGKQITDDEYVVNWGSCSDCFNKGYEAYLKEQEMKAQQEAAEQEKTLPLFVDGDTADDEEDDDEEDAVNIIEDEDEEDDDDDADSGEATDALDEEEDEDEE